MTNNRRAQWIYLLMAFADGVVGKVTFTMSAIYRVDVVGLDVLELVLLGTPELDVILASCLAHGRRRFVDVVASFPEECRHVLEPG